MRELTETLRTAQKAAPFAEPRVRIRLRNRRAGVAIPSWTRLYTGEEPAGPHDAYSGLSTGLFQIRSDPADDKLYTRYIASPHDIGAGVPLVGYTGEGASETALGTSRKAACKYTFPNNLTVDTIYAYLKAAGEGTKAKAVIYSDNAGVPDVLLGTSDEQTTIPTADGWVTFTFSTPVEITAATVCWLGVIFDLATTTHSDAGDADQYGYRPDTYSDGPSDPFGNPVYLPLKMSIYTNGLGSLDWTDTGKTAHAVAVSGTGLNVVAAYIANGSPYHVWYAVSADGGATFGAWTDSGMVSEATGSVAVAVKDASNYALFYTRATHIYAREYYDDGWIAEYGEYHTFTIVSGLAAIYEDYYKLLATGKDADGNPGLWNILYGKHPPDPSHTFKAAYSIIAEPATTAYAYQAPFLDNGDAYRLSVVQHYAAATDQYNQLESAVRTVGTTGVDPWREPYPVTYQSPYGIARAHSSSYLYKTTPDGIWESEYAEVWVDVSNDVLDVIHQDYPLGPRSSLKVTLDNTGGKYNDFAYLGYEINVEWGYLTAVGPEYSDAAHFWVTGWKFVSPPWFPIRSFWPVGIIGTLEIAAQGVWEMLARYHTPRSLPRADVAESVGIQFSEILGKVGFEIEYSTPYDPTLENPHPLNVLAGTSGLSMFKRKVQYSDVLPIQRETDVYFFSPWPTDESVYSYHNLYAISHLLFRGNYQYLSKDPNQVQVWGDAVMEEHYDVDEIEQTEARLKRITAPVYDTVKKTDDRADAELRKGAYRKNKGGWVQTTVNCGIEPGDIVTITDTTAGITAQDFRVLGIESHYRKLYWIFMQKLQLGGI